MPSENRRLILGRGEQLVSQVPRSAAAGPKEYPRSYEVARHKVITAVKRSIEYLDQLPPEKRNPNELVLCLRLHPEMLAKSYQPESIFANVSGLENVGTRIWNAPIREVAQTSYVRDCMENGEEFLDSQLVFVRGNNEIFQRFLNVLDKTVDQLSKEFIQDIRKIEKLDWLDPSEQIDSTLLGQWTEGRVELVFHPSNLKVENQLSFLEKLFTGTDVPFDKIRSAQYAGGPTFFSAWLNRSAIEVLKECNPLRAAHPLPPPVLPDLRTIPGFKGPRPCESKTRSTLTLGVFDGGIDPQNPYFQRFASQDPTFCVAADPDPIFVAHGTAVVGAALYGALNSLSPNDTLPEPPVCVESFRVFPTSDSKDFDLYEAIDLIEKVVPAKLDIKTYNISFGPNVPISDDRVSRFTFALDRLALEHDVTFYIAAGNDGEEVGYSRIQAPSDSVNGLAIGAHTVIGDAIQGARYSCVGPGREGAKTKPELSAFGGCESNPIQVLSPTSGLKIMTAGTSFAAPLAARVGAQIRGRFEGASGVVSRALIIQNAAYPEGFGDRSSGFGCAPEQYEDVLFCSANSVTVCYQGKMESGKWHKLIIPYPDGANFVGDVSICWTIAVLTPVEMLHPGDYTCCGIEEHFHPHDQIYNFTKTSERTGKKQTKKKNLKRDAQEIAQLVSEGFQRGSFPVTFSLGGGGQRVSHPHEQELRALNAKWDTVVRRRVTLDSTAMHSPFLMLHSMRRHGAYKSFRYGAVVTVTGESNNGEVYDHVRRRYPQLESIRLRSEADIRINV